MALSAGFLFSSLTMNLELIVFFILAAALLSCSVLVILQRNAVYCAMALVGALLVLSLLFLNLHAPMVALLQVIVYAGAIMVLFLFVIMLLNPAVPETRRSLWRGVGFAATGILGAQILTLLFLGAKGDGAASVPEEFGSPAVLAKTLFTDFVLPFELVGILLLVALIGAVILAKREL